MELVVDVEIDGETRRVEVAMGLTDPVDVVRVINLCGAGNLARLASGEWVVSAVKAILYVNLVQTLAGGSTVNWNSPPFLLDDVDLDWGDMSEFMVELDSDMESVLADLSELVDDR